MARVPNAVEILSKILNRLNRAHERYRRQTDRRQQIAKVNVSSRSLKTRMWANAQRDGHPVEYR